MTLVNRAITIMLADDPDDSLLTKKVSENPGFSGILRIVNDGEELLRYLNQCITYYDHYYFLLPDIILLDLDITLKYGWEILGEIKKYPELRNIPVIMCSNSNDEKDRVRSIEMDADAFITKPEDYKNLLHILQNLLEKYCRINEDRKVEIPVSIDKTSEGEPNMKYKIMIVDDEEYIRILYTDELKDQGYEVITASSGSRIIERIEKEKPDLIVLDIKLKDHNGLDILQNIKNKFEDIPVGICSAYDTFREDMKSLSAEFYVVRSLNLDELKNSIASSLKDYR